MSCIATARLRTRLAACTAAILTVSTLIAGCSSQTIVTKDYENRVRMSKAEAVQSLKQYLRNEKDIAVDENRLAFTYEKKIIDDVRESGLGVYGLGSKTVHTIYHVEDFHVNIVYAKVVRISKVSYGNGEYLNIYDRNGKNLSGGFDWSRIDDSFISALLALCPNVEYGSTAADPSNEIYLAITEGDLSKLLSMLERSPELVSYKTDYGTPLYIAAEKGKKEAALMIMAKGAGIDELTRKIGGEFAPLHAAAQNGHKEIVELLLAKGADVNVRTDGGSTPLHLAALGGRGDVVEILIAKGAQVNSVNNSGWTPLCSAASKNQIGAARVLIIHKADVNLKTKGGWTPLHISAEHGFRDMAQFLVSWGAAVNVKSNYKYTPLHLAAANNRREAAEALIRIGADLNARNKDGSTPLHLAAEKNHLDIVSVLIAGGADINIRNENGWTPLYVATRGKHWQVANLLRKKGGVE